VVKVKKLGYIANRDTGIRGGARLSAAARGAEEPARVHRPLTRSRALPQPVAKLALADRKLYLNYRKWTGRRPR